jgi:hypothetical protein
VLFGLAKKSNSTSFHSLLMKENTDRCLDVEQRSSDLLYDRSFGVSASGHVIYSDFDVVAEERQIAGGFW